MSGEAKEAGCSHLPGVGETERLLLQAAILPAPAAERAWERFCRLTPDIEKATDAAYGYFPAIAARLAGEPERIEHFSRLQSVLRHSWARRQLVLSRLLPVFGKLAERKIDFILLKGLGISFSYRPYRGERYLVDAGLLVQAEQERAALTLLQEAGWGIEAGGASPETRLSFAGGESLTVQTQLFPGYTPAAAQTGVWRRAVPGGFPGAAWRILDPLHQFLEACHRASPRSALLEANPGLLDAVHALTPGFPWRRLEPVAHRWGVVAPVRRVLLALAETGFALPDEVVSHWRELRLEADDRALLAARLGELESLPAVRRYRSRERTRELARGYLQHAEPAGFLAFWRGAAACAGREHHLRAYNRRAYFYGVILRGYLRKRRG
jgi:hypothetical protein